MARDIRGFKERIAETYKKHAPTSAAWNARAIKYQIDGGSHALRLIKPFPPRIASAKGAWVKDEDGNSILDFWQGHFANILGHNPEIITTQLAQLLDEGNGLQSGFTDKFQVKVAEILCRQTGYERVRFTTSGTLATMYSIMLAKAFTGRELVMKAGGGWHGANLWGLKGSSWRNGFGAVDSAGIPAAMSDEVLLTAFNNPQILEDQFHRFGNKLACLILEPVMGAGGLLPARAEYLAKARELSSRYGTVLIFDEVITGFRYRAGDVAELYGVKGDLAVFGKIIGGGMPVAAVAGREDIMEMAGRSRDNAVKFSGGTYSGHPASMLAASTMLNHLVQNESQLYSCMEHGAGELRRIVTEAFSEAGIHIRFAGDLIHDLPFNSLHMLVFPRRQDLRLETPEEIYNPKFCDLELSEDILPLVMLLEDVYIVHGLGSTTAAHTSDDLQYLREAIGRVASRIKPIYQVI
ncbi:MAG TPA: aminotransferase class III-fold pyridoxal phosphate-dependent enzyme [candidate division Zixibacteria bacterium]|nr:aminotransferase class III-fold pyridoxal phosphate-dependent enzyme [candidate division Zixibacteria bacterium]